MGEEVSIENERRAALIRANTLKSAIKIEREFLDECVRAETQEELAERIGISTTHMSHIETGNTKLSLPVLVSIADVLEVRTDDLLNRCTSGTATALSEEICTILDHCSAKEAKIISDIVKAAKVSMDKYL